MKNEVVMSVDLRKHPGIRDQVHAGLKCLLVQGRQIWEGAPSATPPHRHDLHEIVERLMVGVGDLARLARDNIGPDPTDGDFTSSVRWISTKEAVRRETMKELGNIVFSTIRWIDDLGLDPLECLELAIEAQERFVESGRPR